jgi:putative methyltransferase (TIGR04325 family)
MTFRQYCTYLDHNYVPRVLVMADSLRRHGGDFRLHVLCLSDLCARMLTALAVPEIVPIRLDAFEQRYPDLLHIKPTRTTVEYFFTLTPFLPAYCMDRDADLLEITYLDSDLCFFTDPQAIFDVIGDRSIGIVPQHLSPYWSFAVKFGRFNVGWITYRRTDPGLRCLLKYCQDCFAWCFERLEPGRYSDQKYLDLWPAAFPNDLAVVDHKGVNVALYNVDAYAVTEHDDRIWCDDEPLIFYHFHGVYQDTDGNYAVSLPIEHGEREDTVIRRIYRPYLARLIEQRQLLLRRFPELAAAAQVTRVFPIEPPKAIDLAGWHGDTLTRIRLTHAIDLRERVRAGAPGGDAALEHLLEIAGALVDVAAESDALAVLDWGGGFGELHWCAQALQPARRFAWHVRELGTVCDHGAAVFPETTFHDDDASAFARPYDVAFAVGALPYAADWRAVLGQLAQAARQLLVLVDVPMSDAGTALFIQERPLASLPDAVFASPVLPTPTVHAMLAAAGWELARELSTSFVPPASGDAPPVVYRSLVFRRAARAQG